MIRVLVFIVSLLLGPLVNSAEQDIDTLSVIPESLYRADTALVWNGPASLHNFNPALARIKPFPPIEWQGGEFNSGEAWYEFDMPASKIPEGLAGILITRVYLTADVYLNGVLIGSGGTMESPIARNAHRPLYFSFPQSAWSVGENKVRIHHKSYPNTGHLVDVLAGSDAELRPLFERRNFQQQTIPKTLFIIEILSALFLFYIWLSNREDKSILWFAFSMVMISIFTSNQFLVNTIVSHKFWLVLNNTALDWWAVSLIFFVNSRLGVERAAIRNLLFGYSLLALLYYVSMPLSLLPQAASLHGISMLLSLLNTIYISFSAKRAAALPYILFFCSIQLMSLHDILMQSGIWLVRWLDGSFILFYAAPMACFLVFGKLIREFVSAMQASKDHAANLKMHVDLTRQELEEQYEKLNSVIENQAIEKERERIYRDLHDDVGAKLLSLFYRANDSRLEVLAKSALEDLRDIVSRKTLDGELLETGIKQWESEAEDRVDDQGITLKWVSVGDGSHYQLDERQYTHIKRMLREAISNAMRHNNECSKIAVEITVKDEQLAIKVSNNGLTSDVKSWHHGRGINNMKIRARELSGQFSILSPEPGYASLIWAIPLTKN